SKNAIRRLQFFPFVFGRRKIRSELRQASSHPWCRTRKSRRQTSHSRRAVGTLGTADLQGHGFSEAQPRIRSRGRESAAGTCVGFQSGSLAARAHGRAARGRKRFRAGSFGAQRIVNPERQSRSDSRGSGNNAPPLRVGHWKCKCFARADVLYPRRRLVRLALRCRVRQRVRASTPGTKQRGEENACMTEYAQATRRLRSLE